MPRNVSLSLELLETFVTLIEHGGEAKAAGKVLGIKQASMSKRIRYLQHKNDVLEHPWIVRNGRRWELTDEGSKAFPAVQQLILRYNQLIDSSDKKQADLAFACGRGAVLGFVRVALKKFRSSNPDLRLRISTLRGAARIEGVANGSLDLATVANDEDTIHQIARRKLHIETIASNRLGLVCSSSSPWAKELRKEAKAGLKPSSFKDYPLIIPEPDAGVRQRLEAIFDKHKLLGKLDIRLEIGGWGTILDYVRDGHGVGVISESAVRMSNDLVAGYFNPRSIPPTTTKIICRHKVDSDNLDLTDLAQEFYDLLKTTASKNPK